MVILKLFSDFTENKMSEDDDFPPLTQRTLQAIDEVNPPHVDVPPSFVEVNILSIHAYSKLSILLILLQ